MGSPDELVDAMPARSLKAMMPVLLESFLPDSQRDRFEREAMRWSERTPFEWDDMFFSRRSDLEALLRKLEGWMDIEDWSLPLSDPACDEALLLLYVLKVQAAVISILHLPDEHFVPGKMEAMWRWMTSLGKAETWADWTILKQGWTEQLPAPPKIWSMPKPRGI